MAEGGPSKKLIHEAAYSGWIECATIAMRIHVLFEIAFTVLEYEYELCFCMNNVVQPDDVDVLELLHERDLADRSGWCAFFSIEMYLLQSHDLVCCS